MYSYDWDPETGGYVMNSTPLSFSKEPRPVYYRELDILGFDKHWNYEKQDDVPYMWAEANSYWYRGRKVAQTKGGSLYCAPELVLLEDPEPDHAPLRPVDIDEMVRRNHDFMQGFVQETIRNVYNTWQQYRDKVDVFYVAFSGGKDSIVTLDIVQNALPHDAFMVLFGDTQMEFPDTYDLIKSVIEKCNQLEIAFHTAKSELTPDETWQSFGPPATSNRFCCSVHKTSPQINLLRKITGKNNFTGFAFTGIRREESSSRSEYDAINDGKKHQGQYSYHAILEWNSAELFLYMYDHDLPINKAYKKGCSRAGCLVCPNSIGRNDFIKRTIYTADMDRFLNYIAKTSGKHYSDEEMKHFIDAGYWRTRRSGKELNFGEDGFDVENSHDKLIVNVFQKHISWEQWAKTVGTFIKIDDHNYQISLYNKIYKITLNPTSFGLKFTIPDLDNSKEDIQFRTLFKSVIIKSIYCIGCRVCEAECKFNCIHMENGIEIGDNCVHCHKCHEVHEHCLRYNSIRNKASEGNGMSTKKGMANYFSFGIEKTWMTIFAQNNGSKDFWLSEGNHTVANKKEDAFQNFLKDSYIIISDSELKKANIAELKEQYRLEGESEDEIKATLKKFQKYLGNRLTKTGEIILDLGIEESVAWELMLANLAYTTDFKWFVTNMQRGYRYTTEQIKYMLQDAMPNDKEGGGKSNYIYAFRTMLAKTPFGTEQILANAEIDESDALIAVTRYGYTPDPRVILYSLYKFADKCDGYYDFRLSYLMDDNEVREGISPARIFGLDRDTMQRALEGLSINYPQLIHAAFNLDLESISLKEHRKPEEKTHEQYMERILQMIFA